MPAKASTKRHRSFAVVQLDEVEPISFDLGGETFNCYPQIQGKTLIDIMRVAADSDEETRGMMMAVSVIDFFQKVMTAEEYERFSALLEDPQRIVPMETLSDIMSWLIEEYAERPTQQSSDS